jgi:hypothetical protein
MIATVRTFREEEKARDLADQISANGVVCRHSYCKAAYPRPWVVECELGLLAKALQIIQEKRL